MMIVENYNIGAEAIKNQQYKESIQYFTKAINENNLIGFSFSLAYFYRAIAYYYTSEFEKAIADFSESSYVMKDDFKFYFFRGLNYFSLKNYDEAEIDFNKVIEINVDFYEVNIYLYEIYKIKNKDNLSLSLAKKIIELNPKGINELSKLGTKYLDQDAFQIAKNIYLDIYKLCPESVSALQGLAITNGHQKNYEESIAFFDLLIKLDPENMEHHKNNRELSLNELNNVDNSPVSTSKDIVINLKQNPNKWQKDILSALELEGTFKMDFWDNKLNADKDGFIFMQSVAQSQPAYSHLNSLGLVNRGFCPITGEKIEKGWMYDSNGRKIYLSESANEIGAKRKVEVLKKLEESNRNNVENNPELKKRVQSAQMRNVYWRLISIFVAFCLTYNIIKPSNILDYIKAIGLFVLLFYVMKVVVVIVRIIIGK
jgi:tetratricopeptide (TPR) repeat protein